MKSLRLLLVSVLFIVLLNEPVISIANKPVLVLGIPLLFIYVTCVWLVMIGIIAYIIYSDYPADDSLNSDE